jgi:hypothetical protein
MHRSGADADALDLEVPDGIVAVRIDPTSGELEAPGCPEAFWEYFERGTEPRTSCPLHQSRFRRWWRDLGR